MTRTPHEFLLARESWLAGPGSVRVQERDCGGWDVVLRLDGAYTSKGDAEYIARSFQREIHAIARRLRDDLSRSRRTCCLRDSDPRAAFVGQEATQGRKPCKESHRE